MGDRDRGSQLVLKLSQCDRLAKRIKSARVTEMRYQQKKLTSELYVMSYIER